ncbi:MDR family MFS transporter [Longispora albida]|uniref:MDR family MFS transporter n=1 Tax=Longispora albida TaxID=203523 RepID=UPI00037B9716|nr:MFS transporter [Longispora albida]
MSGWLRQTAGGLPRTFWFLWTATLISRSGAFVITLLTFYLKKDRGFDATFVGLVIGLMGGGGAIGVLLGGQLADRWGRRKTLLLANTGTAAALVLLGLAHAKAEILVASFAVGLVQNMSRPAFTAMMTDIIPDADRMRGFNLNYWAINLGFSFAAILGGLVAELDYLLIFVVNAVTMLVTALLVFFLVPESRPQDVPVVQRKTEEAPGTNPFTDPAFMILVGLTFMSAMIFMQHVSSLPLAMEREGFSPTMFGLVASLNGIMIVVGQLFIPRLVRGRDTARVLALAQLVMGIGFGLTAFAHDAWAYAVTILIWTFGEMLNAPAASTLSADLSPVAARGRYQGAYSLAFSAAAFVAPLAGGFVFQHFGSAALWLSCLALGILTAAFCVVAGPSWARRGAVLRAQTPAEVKA